MYKCCTQEFATERYIKFMTIPPTKHLADREEDCFPIMLVEVTMHAGKREEKRVEECMKATTFRQRGKSHV